MNVDCYSLACPVFFVMQPFAVAVLCFAQVMTLVKPLVKLLCTSASCQISLPCCVLLCPRYPPLRSLCLHAHLARAKGCVYHFSLAKMHSLLLFYRQRDMVELSYEATLLLLSPEKLQQTKPAIKGFMCRLKVGNASMYSTCRMFCTPMQLVCSRC